MSGSARLRSTEPSPLFSWDPGKSDLAHRKAGNCHAAVTSSSLAGLFMHIDGGYKSSFVATAKRQTYLNHEPLDAIIAYHLLQTRLRRSEFALGQYFRIHLSFPKWNNRLVLTARAKEQLRCGPADHRARRQLTLEGLASGVQHGKGARGTEDKTEQVSECSFRYIYCKCSSAISFTRT